MDEFLSDQEQIERIKKWWLDNWKSILAGIIIALIIIFGWRYWQHRTQVRSLTASAMYNQMGALLTEAQGPQALQVANQLVNNYADTPYAAQAALAMAQYDVGTNKPDDAMQMLGWVINHSKDDGLKLLARLRMAHVKLSVGDPRAALAALSGVAAAGFAPLYDEARGDAYVKLGESAQARAAYQSALQAWTPQLGDKSLLQMKLDALGGPAPAAASTTPAPGAQSGAKQP
ncbi:MAG: YfgM family protein [Gammaproteobacteria bacterium]